jgi:MGT family glycosyltransferase
MIPTDRSPRPSTFLVALVDGGGTVPPELAAVRALVERGHRVTVLAEDSMIADVQATGATFRRWEQAPNRPDRRPENDPYRDWECKTPFQLFARLLDSQFVGPAARYAADVTVAIESARPDVILCSQFAFGAMIAAEAAGIAFDVLMPNVYLLPSPGTPPMGMGLQPARGRLGRARDRLITRMTARLWDKGLPRLNSVRAQHGLGPIESFFEQMHRARAEVVMTSPAFDFGGARADNVHYVGPVLDDPTWVEPWTPPPGDDPLVLVAMSSTFQDHAACLQRIVDALGGLAVRAVVTTGPTLDPDSVIASPNVTVVRSAPHAQVLHHAAAVVTHGGHGTVIKTLAAGVPMVVLAHGRDQADNAARVTARGAGISLRKSATPRAIARAVARLLDDPSYRHAAGRLGATIRDDAAAGELVRVIEASIPASC